MRYITHRRLKDVTMSGRMNIPALTVLECENDLISYNNLPICFATSENAHQHFARDDDGQGLRRGKLTQGIQAALARQAFHQERWDLVWADEICNKYRRTDHPEYFLWNHEFFNAPIEDLVHIAKLVSAKEEK